MENTQLGDISYFNILSKINQLYNSNVEDIQEQKSMNEKHFKFDVSTVGKFYFNTGDNI